MQDNAYEDALPRISEGIRRAARIVSRTLGPRGTNMIIQSKLNPGMITTNDGATGIQALNWSDPVENIGLQYAKEMAARSNNNSGDGSTTSIVLLDAILQEGLKVISEGKVSALEVKQSLDETLPIIESAIRDQTKTITVDDIPAVAEVAGENKELAQTLGDIYRRIGSSGIVHLEGSGTYQTSYSIIDGVRLVDTGFLSPYMATEGKKATYQKPSILVTKRKIENVKEINPLLNALIARGDKALVIFADDMDSNVARLLVELQKNPERSINILIIKAPVFWKNYVFEDFAKMTGSTIVEDASGINFKTLKLDHLGTCDTLICDKDETIVIGIKDITEHLEAIKADESLPSQDKAVRLAYLSTKTAILKLGAKSETELSYLRLKAEDAIHSSRLALQSGIVAGAGSSLAGVAHVMPNTIGGRILAKALEAPSQQIVTNAGVVYAENQYPDGIYGIDVKTGKMENMFEAGIVDAASVVLQAVRNSLGIASTILTASSVILLPKEDKPITNNFPFGA